jgi:hypothetical protein
MTYTIILWTLIFMTTIWIISRLRFAFKQTDLLLHLKKPHQLIRSWSTRNYTMTSLYVIVAWWISFMFVESLKLYIKDVSSSDLHVIAIVIIPALMISIYFSMNRIKTKKYNISISEICSRLDRTFCIIIAFLYATIISYGIEAIMLIMSSS